jgi:hypothetical protein
MQYEPLPQTPFALQSCEQQSLAAVHGLPSVLQVAFSGVQVPLVPHVPPQHWPLLEQAWPSAVHWLAEHTWFTQLVVQQSVFAVHAEPAPVQLVIFVPQVPLVSQKLEQQSPATVHTSPNARHDRFASTRRTVPSPGSLASMVDPDLLPQAQQMTRNAATRERVIASVYRCSDRRRD